MLGGSAGGQEYSLASMLDCAPHKHNIKQGDLMRHSKIHNWTRCTALSSLLTISIHAPASNHAWVTEAFLSRIVFFHAEGETSDLNSKLSAGEQDLLAGTGTVEGEEGHKPSFNIRYGAFEASWCTSTCVQ